MKLSIIIPVLTGEEIGYAHVIPQTVLVND